MPPGGEGGGDVDRKGGLPDAAFLIEEGDNHEPTLPDFVGTWKAPFAQTHILSFVGRIDRPTPR